eukprot:CAMPEP_0116838428 /NCGR_PEP_ID=MMETSP0418-20121206/9210_1 /TAXON_ID=1158023 /ORGANISM="Astrosyne radiata, Strain 13vi08-1A" /LENGTH=148 /DNA_ID=CAMNT_0004468435 /DNA_START=26 /DNA_END=472 /DNA_ORIENTATION=+
MASKQTAATGNRNPPSNTISTSSTYGAISGSANGGGGSAYGAVGGTNTGTVNKVGYTSSGAVPTNTPGGGGGGTFGAGNVGGSSYSTATNGAGNVAYGVGPGRNDAGGVVGILDGSGNPEGNAATTTSAVGSPQTYGGVASGGTHGGG